MGYYTDFTINWDIDKNDISAVSDEELCKAFDDAIGGVDHWGDGVWFNGKWYDMEDDMLKISARFPSVLFHIHGDGEASDDLWEDHWQNGRHHLCVAEIPPYDP